MGHAYKVIPVDKSRYVKLKNATNLGSPKQSFEIHVILDYQTMERHTNYIINHL